MKKIILFLIIFHVNAEDKVNWPKLFYAMAMVESNINDEAHNKIENAIGRFQIRPVYVREINRIYNTNYKHSDFKNPIMGKFAIVHHNRYWCKRRNVPLTAENICKFHNAGPRALIPGHIRYQNAIDYWKKVKYFINK